MIPLIPRRLLIKAMTAALAGAAIAPAARAAGLSSARPASSAISAHSFTLPGIDGAPIALERFAGQPVLIVNTASHCGFAGQLTGLQRLYETYGPRGLVVLAVPSNDFGGQEPGDADAIVSFASGEHGVTFPMAAKTAILGDGAHPFYRWAARQAGAAGGPRWNFHKYLIGADGSLIGSYPTHLAPDDRRLIAAVESALMTPVSQ